MGYRLLQKESLVILWPGHAMAVSGFLMDGLYLDLRKLFEDWSWQL